MKTFSAEALAALASGQVTVAGAVWIAAPEPYGFWSGHGNLVLDGQPHVGVGDDGLVTVLGGTLGGSEQGAELSLSGVDPDVAASLDLQALRGLPVIIRRLIFDAPGAVLLHSAVYLRGRIDTVQTVETPGGTATIEVGVESAARGLGRRSERMRTDADQRLIVDTDGGFRRVAHAAEKIIYFGGQPPARLGGVVGGGTATGGGSGDPGITVRREVL